MAHEYANRAFSSLEAAEDANWEFASSDTAEAEQEMLHHRQHLTAPSVKLFVQCQWSKMTRVQTELMFQAIESYKPGTRLRFSLQQMWDAIAMIRNLYKVLSNNQSYSFEALQHLAKQPAALPSKVSKEGLSLPQFEQLIMHLVKVRNDGVRWVAFMTVSSEQCAHVL